MYITCIYHNINLILIGYGVVDAVLGEELTKLTWETVGYMFLIGVGFTGYTGYRMYQYAIEKSLEQIFGNYYWFLENSDSVC